MNCQDARESLSMLLDGDLGLTERVPLEIHVNTCGECRQKLTDLQILKAVEEKPAPRPIHHWPPILAAGLVGRALGAIRTEDAVSRLRRLVVERFPPRQLAAAAAVPIVIVLAIFIFERGFAVGTAMRQRPSSTPSALRGSPPAPPPAIATDPVAATPSPPTPGVPAQSTTVPASPAKAPDPPRQAAPPVEGARVARTKAAETTAPESRVNARPAAPRSAKTESKAKPVPAVSPHAESLAAARALPAKPAGAPADSTAAGASRRGAVDVVGRLQVKSRSEAERHLAALLARAGGTPVSRQRGPAVTVVEAAVPQATYGQFAQGLGRLGAWRLEAERSPLPDLVQVSVRLAD